MKTSIIICTYNRSELLGETLGVIASQNFPNEEFEIIVVDNNSCDNTAEVVSSRKECSNVAIRYVFEARQGLSIAKNTGIAVARGEIIAFTDDDISAEKDWLQSLVDAFDDSRVACAGGPIRPLWPGEKPAWLTPRWEGCLSVSEFDQARIAGRFSWPHYPWGGNIAFRRRVFDEIGNFPTELGRVGELLLSNEEISLCRRVEDRGWLIKFVPGAIIYHKIFAERLKRQWFYHRMYYQGRSNAILDDGDSVARRRRIRGYCTELCSGTPAGDPAGFHRKCLERALLGYLDQSLCGEDAGTGRKTRERLQLLKATVAGLLDEYRRQEQRVFAFEKSWSWRMTAPLRGLLRMVAGSRS